MGGIQENVVSVARGEHHTDMANKAWAQRTGGLRNDTKSPCGHRVEAGHWHEPTVDLRKDTLSSGGVGSSDR
jgi:hypothetical protein